MQRHSQVLVALIAGAVVGGILHTWHGAPWLEALDRHALQPVGQVFLRLLFMSVVPLVFSALVLGVVELAEGRGLGRVATRTLGWTVLATTSSVVIGVTLVSVLQPGAGYQLDATTLQTQLGNVREVQAQAAKGGGFGQAIIEMVPKNPVEAAARALQGDMLPFMVFALLFGAALAATARKDRPPAAIPVLQDVFDAASTLVGWALKLAPAGVFALVCATLLKHGVGFLGALGGYVFAVVLGLAIQMGVVYALMLKFGARRSPVAFFTTCRDVLTHAFSTASSNATLPLSLEAAEHRLGIDPRVGRFVLTIGATGNQNGTALFEGVTVLFLAQVYGIHLDLAAQAQVVGLSIVAGIGAAGVPGSSLPMIMVLLGQIGVPPEGLGLILGADRFLDMCRTTVNVAGDLVIAAVVDRGERAE